MFKKFKLSVTITLCLQPKHVLCVPTIRLCILTMVCIMSTDNLIAKLALDMVVATRHENSILQLD
jgi:hypothetical protein